MSKTCLIQKIDGNYYYVDGGFYEIVSSNHSFFFNIEEKISHIGDIDFRGKLQEIEDPELIKNLRKKIEKSIKEKTKPITIKILLSDEEFFDYNDGEEIKKKKNLNRFELMDME